MELTDANVLVIGGAGFLGSHVTERLLSEGAAVTVFDDLSVGKRELVPNGAELVVGDVRDDELRETVTDVNPDAIVHLAAIHYIPYCNGHPEEAFEVNVMGTRNLMAAARHASPDVVVFASSAAVYPPRDGPHVEDSTVDPMDIYGRTKLIGEDLTRLFHVDTDVPAVSARLFNIYGPNETNMHLVPAVLEQVAESEAAIELGNLTPCRDFVHVDDVARAIAAFLRKHKSGYEAYNVGTGAERSVREVAEGIIDASGKRLVIEQDEERVRESDRPHLQASVEKIRAEIGWEPTVDFGDGVHDLLSEYGIER